MMQLPEDMMRASRRFDAAGRPVSRDLANRIAARTALGAMREEGRIGFLTRVLQSIRRLARGPGDGASIPRALRPADEAGS